MGKKTRTSSIQLARIANVVSGKAENQLVFQPEKQIENADQTVQLERLQESPVNAQDSSMEDAVKNVPRGRPKSGKGWKTTRTERYSSIKKDKPLRTTWKKKEKRRDTIKAIKQYAKELKDNRSQELEAKRKRQEENKKRRLENERKAEVVQPIKNMAKIKRMKKKQLRLLAKR